MTVLRFSQSESAKWINYFEAANSFVSDRVAQCIHFSFQGTSTGTVPGIGTVDSVHVVS